MRMTKDEKSQALVMSGFCAVVSSLMAWLSDEAYKELYPVSGTLLFTWAVLFLVASVMIVIGVAKDESI